jgi:elongation factor Ts
VRTAKPPGTLPHIIGSGLRLEGCLCVTGRKNNADLQVAASPDVKFVTTDDIPQAVRDEALAAELQKEDLLSKPEEMRPKIALGRVNKSLLSGCLLEQDYIRDPSKKVSTVIKEAIVQLGENIRVRRFVRFNLGEGLEKKSQDFAAEVAAQTGQA